MLRKTAPDFVASVDKPLHCLNALCPKFVLCIPRFLCGSVLSVGHTVSKGLSKEGTHEGPSGIEFLDHLGQSHCEQTDRGATWHGALHAATVAKSLEQEGFTIRAQIIWAKERLVIGRGDYHWQHEPCWYGVRTKGNWTGDRKQTTLWSISSKNQDAETVHGTQKPVECMRRPILNNTSPGDAVYEPFLGSGTTLIAAESVKRTCFAVELSPAYVDVAVRRWRAFTGKKALRLCDEREFDELAAHPPASEA